MIGRNVKLFCCEDASNIENYDKAIADKENIWHCHHLHYRWVEEKLK